MQTDAQRVFNEFGRQLPPQEQVRLAQLLINAALEQFKPNIDVSDEWTAEDEGDVLAFALNHADKNEMEND